LLQKLIHLN